jgi:16S rRNA (uracil1498-N3)-methyltransferase
MTPPLFLVPDLGSAELLELTGDEARHAVTVKRLTVGELVLLSDGRGALAQGRVVEVDRSRVVFRLSERRRVAEPDPRFVVVQALPKGERADLAIEVLTELGADEIVPWAAARSISQWRGTEKIDRGVAKWRRTAAEATKQSRRARIPSVSELAATGDVLSRLRLADSALVLHESATERLGAQALPASGEVVIVVGPEGGISEEELTAFVEVGARAVRLGDEVMRTSTAGAAALAVLSVSAGRWG